MRSCVRRCSSTGRRRVPTGTRSSESGEAGPDPPGSAGLPSRTRSRWRASRMGRSPAESLRMRRWMSAQAWTARAWREKCARWVGRAHSEPGRGVVREKARSSTTVRPIGWDKDAVSGRLATVALRLDLARRWRERQAACSHGAGGALRRREPSGVACCCRRRSTWISCGVLDSSFVDPVCPFGRVAAG